MFSDWLAILTIDVSNQVLIMEIVVLFL